MVSTNLQLDLRYERLAGLLESPGSGFTIQVETLEREFGDGNPAAGKAMGAFGQALRMLTEGAREELHLRTFDVAPQCIPYLSVHAFGEESFRRSQLMVALSTAYEKTGFDPGIELPDHIGTVLRFLDRLPADERQELFVLAMREPIRAMVKNLERTANPYRFVIEAIDAVLTGDFEEECNA